MELEEGEDHSSDDGQGLEESDVSTEVDSELAKDFDEETRCWLVNI